MKCYKCANIANLKQFNTFSYYYCDVCKEEVKVQSQPNRSGRYICEYLVELLERNDGKQYLYLSEEDTNLDNLNLHLLNSTDIFNTSCKIWFAHPDHNIAYINYSIVFIEDYCTTITQVNKIAPSANVRYVRSDTMEVV